MINLPSKSIGYDTAAEAAQHTPDCEYADGDSVQQFHCLLLNVLIITLLVNVFYKVFNVL